ncbi:excinuclease ABC subunit UvrA [uncultured Alistipes sp.]|uniref:excinuclease ABC subunit UvrA n=1 Tax=uncultured Alistipes sp. TaxID=538949 RepID=UPI00260E3EAA|nr:excinuclease ABC subunit UvrA [uncultured Alistipes sp.]
MSEDRTIKIYGARVHNLKNVDVEIPRDSLTVITGLSGSGKSSLAFDTIYAEGQRRYLETLSTYARQFVGTMERPDVDKITGLSPVISIEQKTTNKNPRSTVGTVTEINDFLRLLFARASDAYSPVTGEIMVHHTDEQIVDLILRDYSGRKVALLAPLVQGRKGHYRELFESLAKKGYLYARIDGEIREIFNGMRLDRYKVHHIELVVDRLVVKEDIRERTLKSLRETMRQGKGTTVLYDYDTGDVRFYSRHLMCPTSGIAFNEPAPHTFSFNSPQGACPHCNGLGEEAVFDMHRVVPDSSRSIRQGGIEPLGKYKNNLLFARMEALGRKYGFTLDDPIESLDERALGAVLYGESEPLHIDARELGGTGNYMVSWEGVADYIEKQQEDASSGKGDKWKEQFVVRRVCSVCGGSRLRSEALQFRIDGKNIAELSALSIEDFAAWMEGLENRISRKQESIAREILKEIRERLRFLLDVGLGYLSLSRSSRSLSGGESQRIRLATQIGSKLVNVLYILDEPSIGLHQRDNIRLINSLKALRDAGNSVIVVEHDEDMMRSADWIVDVGPRAGVNGGEICAAGPLSEIMRSGTVTAEYLSGRRRIDIPRRRRPGNGQSLWVRGARGNNLKNIDVEFPLGRMICVTGVSGSGKSSLVNATLRYAVSRVLYNSFEQPLDYDRIEGIEHIDKLVVVDQSPIGRTPRSNPATYSNVFGDIRKLFEATPDAQIRGFKAGRFSFNVKGGRCEACRGAGVQTIEMNFLPDVYVKCGVCDGHRYNRETLEVKYKGKSIDDVLNMTVNQAVEFFGAIPSIHMKLKAIQDVGLGYLTLGQPCTTLSGGESQRIKLSAELAKRDTGRTLYILDEPTTGLHFEDIRVLLGVLDKLVEKGNTVIVIEHNLDVIKVADYLIDIGPEGGREGGRLVACGTPEEVARIGESYTGRFLEPLFGRR